MRTLLLFLVLLAGILQEPVAKLHGDEKSMIFDSIESPCVAWSCRADGGLPRRAGEEERAQESQKERFYAPKRFATGSDAKWLTDDKIAFEKARAEEKPLLFVFLGSGWCPWSDKIAQEILGKKEFADILSRDFVLVKIDCPERSIQSIKERYGVQQCPFFLILDESGERVAEIEYLGLGAGAYADHLKALWANFNLLKGVLKKVPLEQLSFGELKHLHQRAKGLANDGLKNAIVSAGVKVDPGVEFLLEEYVALVKAGSASSELALELKDKIVARDPNNALGARLKIALIDFERLSKQSDQAHRPLVDYVKQFGSSDQQNLWQIEMAISQFLFSRNQVKEAIEHAEASLIAAPQESKSQVAKALEYLQNHGMESD